MIKSPTRNCLAGTAITNSLGGYAIDGLPAGNYFARTRNNLGLLDRLFGGGVCNSNCDPAQQLPYRPPLR